MDTINQPPVIIASSASDFSGEEQNQVIQKWIPKVRRLLKSNARQFADGKTKRFVIRGNQNEGKLVNSIRSKTREDFGVIDTVSFQFERHGVFVHKGVGRGYQMSGSKVVRTATSKPTKIRKAVEWFNPVLEQNIPELADKIALINTNAAVKATQMKIH